MQTLCFSLHYVSFPSEWQCSYKTVVWQQMWIAVQRSKSNLPSEKRQQTRGKCLKANLNLLFEENAIFCPGTINLLFCAIQRTPIPSSFGSSLLELPHLFSPFKGCILIRIMSKTLLKIVAYNNQSGHHFSSRDLVQPTTTKILQNCKKVPYRPVLNISRAWFKICAWHSFERSSYFSVCSLLTCLLSLWVSLQKPSSTFSFG